MKWRIFISVLSVPFFTIAQNAEDAIRLSFNLPGGTGRTLGMAGAAGAMGVDYGTTLINPAGMAMARQSVLMTGITLQSYGNSSTYIGETESVNNFRAVMPAFGLSLANLSKNPDGTLKTKGVVSWNIHFGFTRANDFSRQINFQGTNAASSVLDQWAWDSYGLTPQQLEGESSLRGLAWSTFLIDRIPNSNPPDYEAALLNESKARQNMQLNRTGRINDWHLGMGMNIANNVFLGGAMLFPGIRFNNQLVYRENYDVNINGVPGSMQQNSSFSSEGTGFGGRFGIIFKVSETLRFGAAAQTRIRYGITDLFGDSIQSTGFVNPGQSLRYGTQLLQTRYTIITPARYTLSATAILRKVLVLNADYEMLNYSKSTLTSADYQFAAENNDIKLLYRNAHNIRIGAEYAYFDWRFRTGFGINQQPYNPVVLGDYQASKLNMKNLSFGAGYINKRVFVDAAIMRSWYNDFYTPYSLDPAMNREFYSAENSFGITRFILTAGIRW